MTTLFFQLKGELWKLFARKRTYMGFLVFLLLEAIILILFQVKGGEGFKRLITQRGEAFETYYSALTLGFIILQISIFLLGSLYVSLVAGDIVAKESEDGHLRMLLARPVSRLRLLGLKYVGCLLYAFGLVQFITWTAFGLGLIVRGWGGGLFAFAPTLGTAGFFSWEEGLQRYLIGSCLLAMAMMTVASIGFFFSCMKIKPAAATISTLSYVLMDSILRESHFMDSYQYLLVTRYMIVWIQAFADTIPWAFVARNYAVLFGINASLFVLGAAYFESRDLKS
jgi:ABC-2 type transport system permease protein